MTNAARADRRKAYALERKAFVSGNWGEWRATALPLGVPGAHGWATEIHTVLTNDLYCVMIRTVQSDIGPIEHCAIRTASNLEPPWRDKQRIKRELFNPDVIAIEFMPVDAEIVDEADLYHIWVMPPDWQMPASLYQRRKED